MRSLLLVSIGFFVLGVGYYYSKSPKYDECLRLYNVVSNGNVEKDLLLWVDENFDNIITMKGYDKASGVYPGNMKLVVIISIGIYWGLIKIWQVLD